LLVDLRRAGVEAVLEQLLEDGGGAFDDLAGGDLADQEVGKGMDARHERPIIGVG
jgi:hypothetical protein